MDQRLDSFANWITTNAVYYALVAFNTVSNFVYWSSGAAVRSWNAIVDAHREDLWLFTERNGTPWVIKNTRRRDRDTLDTVEMVGEHTYYVYRPEKMLFQRLTFHPDHMEWSVQEGGSGTGFTDVVFARILQTETSQSWDVSSFFHNIRWTSAAGNASGAPSLLEIASVCLLSSNIVVGKQELLEKFVLEVMTADGEERSLLLDPQPFSGWPAPLSEDDVMEETPSESEESGGAVSEGSSLEEGQIRE